MNWKKIVKVGFKIAKVIYREKQEAKAKKDAEQPKRVPNSTGE